MAATSLGAESAHENPCPRTGTADFIALTIPPGLSEAMSAAVHGYRTAVVDEWSPISAAPRAGRLQSAAAALAAVPATTIADIGAKVTIAIREISPAVDRDRPGALLASAEHFPTDAAFELLISAARDTSALAGAADAPLIELGRRFRAALHAYNAAPDDDEAAERDAWAALTALDDAIVAHPARTPAGAAEKLLAALWGADVPAWLASAVAADDFATIVARKDELLDRSHLAIVAALEALGLPAGTSRPASPAAGAVAWAELEAQLAEARAAIGAAGNADQVVEAAVARETEIVLAVIALPTVDVAHAVRKLELRATFFGQTDRLADAFAEVRQLAGIVPILGGQA